MILVAHQREDEFANITKACNRDDYSNLIFEIPAGSVSIQMDNESIKDFVSRVMEHLEEQEGEE